MSRSSTPDGDPSAQLLELGASVDTDFLQKHREHFLREIVRVPGTETVRAILIRHAEQLEPDAQRRADLLQSAASALRTFPDQVAGGDPLTLMVRHPAWVALAHLELAEQLGGELEDALAVAIQHAKIGFAIGAGEFGEGEILWAIAEAADEAGWSERSLQLLEFAERAEFASSSAKQQARLLLATGLINQQPARAASLLEELLASEESPHEVVVQGSFLRSRIAESMNDISAAIRWMEVANGHIHVDDSTDVRRRLHEEIVRLNDLNALAH